MEYSTAGASVPLDRGIGDLAGSNVTRVLLRGGPNHCARSVGRNEPPDHGPWELDDHAAVDSGGYLTQVLQGLRKVSASPTLGTFFFFHCRAKLVIVV